MFPILTGSEERIRQVLTSMLAGNAFFLHSNPPTLFQSETYIKSRNEHTLYHEGGEPFPFMVILSTEHFHNVLNDCSYTEIGGISYLYMWYYDIYVHMYISATYSILKQRDAIKSDYCSKFKKGCYII